MHKVLRGGSYYTFEKYCKVTSRYGVTPNGGILITGCG